MINKIRTAVEYNQVMQIIEGYLHKATKGGGFQTLTPPEKKELQQLSLLAKAYEDSIPLIPIKQPETLTDMIELKMYQMKLKQKDMADLVGVSSSHLSEVLKGKLKIIMDLAKRLYDRLDIDAGFVLRCE